VFPPLAAPQILAVTAQCADPVLLDGRADFVVFNPNYLFLGGTGELDYDWTLASTSAVVESGSGYYFNTSGFYQFFEEPLPPDTYTATISVTAFPAMSDSSVTFTIHDCSVDPQPGPSPLDVYGLSTFCIPGDDTATLFFVVDVLNPDTIDWVVMDGQVMVAGKSQVSFDGNVGNPLSVRFLPAGSYKLVVTSNNQSANVSTPFEIGSCAPAIDPTDPTTTTDPAQPTTTTTIGEAGPTTSSPIGPTVGSGTLPPTGLTGVLPATR